MGRIAQTTTPAGKPKGIKVTRGKPIPNKLIGGGVGGVSKQTRSKTAKTTTTTKPSTITKKVGGGAKKKSVATTTATATAAAATKATSKKVPKQTTTTVNAKNKKKTGKQTTTTQTKNVRASKGTTNNNNKSKKSAAPTTPKPTTKPKGNQKKKITTTTTTTTASRKETEQRKTKKKQQQDDGSTTKDKEETTTQPRRRLRKEGGKDSIGAIRQKLNYKRLINDAGKRFLNKPVLKGISKPIRIFKEGKDREALLNRVGITRAQKGLMKLLSDMISNDCKRISRQLYVTILKNYNSSLNNLQSQPASIASGKSTLMPRLLGKHVDQALSNLGHNFMFANPS